MLFGLNWFIGVSLLALITITKYVEKPKRKKKIERPIMFRIGSFFQIEKATKPISNAAIRLIINAGLKLISFRI